MLVVFFALVWSWQTVMLQLSGLCCTAVVAPIVGSIMVLDSESSYSITDLKHTSTWCWSLHARGQMPAKSTRIQRYKDPATRDLWNYLPIGPENQQAIGAGKPVPPNRPWVALAPLPQALMAYII